MSQNAVGSGMQERVYTPRSRMKQPRELVAEMWRDIFAYRALARRLLARDIRVQYRASFLGPLWILAPAVATAALFTAATEARVIHVGSTDIPYPAYVLFSMTLWLAFLDSLSGPILAISTEKSILARENVPPEPLILARVGTTLFNFAVRFLLVLALFAWFGISIGPGALLAVLPLLFLIALGTGIGLILAPVNGLYQDVSNALPVITMFWFFLTPVVFPPPASGFFGRIVRLNPVTPLLVTSRELATGNGASNVAACLIVGALSLGVLLVGWLAVRLSMPFIVERMSV